MVVSIANQDPVFDEIYVEDEPPTLLKTALVGESLLMLFSFVTAGAALGLYFSASPLALFLAGVALPVATCFAIIFNDPYYEDPIKREKYRAEISRLGLEAFIEKHGWEKLERYGFCFSGSSPLITKETYTQAFFDAPRQVDSPLIWSGLERDLFLEASYDHLATLLLKDLSLLIEDGRFWMAQKRGVFDQQREALLAGISKYLRSAEGYDILAIWTRLERSSLVPVAFPLAPWSGRNCTLVDTFEQAAFQRREELRSKYLETRAALKAVAESARTEILREKEPDMHQLHEISKNLDGDIAWLEKDYLQNVGAIAAEEKELRLKVAAEFEGEKAPFNLYFTFDSCALEELIQTFGMAAIEKSRLAYGFPTTTEWSDKFIAEKNPPLWVSLEKGLLDTRGKTRAEILVLEGLEGPWDIAEKNAALRAIDLGLFEDRTILKDLLGSIDPMRDPIRLLKCYNALDLRRLVPSRWDAYPWLVELGPQFEARRKYFESSDSDPFLQMQQERWHHEVLKMIYDVEDQTKFQSDLEQMPLKEFMLCYGWDCIMQLCLERFAERFFAEFTSAKEQLTSGLLWPLVESGLLDETKKQALESSLLDDLSKWLKKGHVQQALSQGLFTDRRALQGALDRLDPKKERALLLNVWPWMKGNGLVGDLLREITPWFDRAVQGHIDEAGFERAYNSYLAKRDWREKSLVQWARLYGEGPFLNRMMQERSLIDRWERENPLWSSDAWNWVFFERGLLSDEHVSRWIRAWTKRHPTFREKILSADFAKAFRMGLFSEEDLKVITASFHHPSTFVFAKDLIQGLDWIADLQISFTPEEKLLYNWIKDHRLWKDVEALEREFAAYKKKIGWKSDAGFGFDSETKNIEIEESEGLLQKVFGRQ